MEPCQWLATAKTVISVFFPFTEDVRKSTAEVDKEKPSPLWLHGRIEGQRFISKTAEYIVEVLREQGFEAMIPLADERFRSVSGKAFAGDEKWQDKLFSSNWSERHAAFACGLGTFGLSKGIITERGIAGRFLSVITNAEIEPTKRKYTELYEYCTRCGACINNCPVGAISFEKGKEHLSCSDFLNETKKYYSGKYGCGKCQVNVPCEHGIPKR